MDWKLITDGRFYTFGLVRYNKENQQFSDSRIIGLNEVPATYSLKHLLKINSFDNGTDTDALLLEFDAAVAYLLTEERNFLLGKFNLAKDTLKKLSNSTPTNGFVVVSPEGTVVNRKQESQFVYVVKQGSEDSYYFSNEVRAKDDAKCSYVYYIFNGVTAHE